MIISNSIAVVGCNDKREVSNRACYPLAFGGYAKQVAIDVWCARTLKQTAAKAPERRDASTKQRWDEGGKLM